jgi:hypothetical protein
VEREHLAGVRLDHHRPADERVAEQLDDEPLELEVDARPQRGRGLGHEVLAGQPALAHHPAARVHLDEPHALAAAQLPLVLPLQPALPDLLPGLVLLVVRRRELALGDLARVADEAATAAPSG